MRDQRTKFDTDDWVVETVDIELAAHHAVIELVSKGDKAQKSGYVPQVREQRPRKSKKLTHMSLKLP